MSENILEWKVRNLPASFDSKRPFGDTSYSQILLSHRQHNRSFVSKSYIITSNMLRLLKKNLLNLVC
jgi:hypothetical protein